MRARGSFFVGLGVGFLGGSLAILFLDMKTRPVLRDVLRVNFKIEQERNASLASAANDPLRTAFYRWSAADASSRKKIGVFRHGLDGNIDAGLFYPFALLVLGRIDTTGVKGAQMDEGLARAKLALSLEALGLQVPADEQWRSAADLIPMRSADQLHHLAADMIAQERALYVHPSPTSNP